MTGQRGVRRSDLEGHVNAARALLDALGSTNQVRSVEARQRALSVLSAALSEQARTIADHIDGEATRYANSTEDPG